MNESCRPSQNDRWTVIVRTYRPAGLPHIEHLVSSNPSARIYVDSAPAAENPQVRHRLWRNCDRQMRDFWKKNRHRIPGNRIAMIEHDVLVTQPLPDLQPTGLVAKTTHHGKPWIWWNETERLEELRTFAIGISPLAVLFFSRAALDGLIEDRWNPWFEKDIFCELRIPTLIAAMGLPVESHPMPDVRSGIGAPSSRPGIYHAIKKAIPLPQQEV